MIHKLKKPLASGMNRGNTLVMFVNDIYKEFK